MEQMMNDKAGKTRRTSAVDTKTIYIAVNI